jgi:tetratricopeptide (TPR) repeat protein
MSEFQIILLLLAVTIFAIFFKQLFSGNHPKRGVDFEPKTPNNQVGTINRPDKIFKKVEQTPQTKDRTKELFDMAKESLNKGDKEDAKKALDAILIREPNNLEALRILATFELEDNNLKEAKEKFLKILQHNPTDDLTINHLANTLHKLGEDQEAIKYHEMAINLDSNYAPYYFNYANTLYDLNRLDEALSLYKKALELDPNLEEAKKAIREIENGSN